MAYFVGTDEAGYGPNLGPLVIAATLWQVPESRKTCDLYELLDGVVTRQPAGLRMAGVVPIADSKRLYQSGAGLGSLESGLFPTLAAIGVSFTRWQEIWPRLAPGCEGDIRSIPWYRQFDLALPVDADAGQLPCRAESFQQGIAQHGIQLLDVRARVVVADQFNRLVDRWGGKGALLSSGTMELVSELVTPLRTGSILVHCDKHGGRNHYLPLLQHHFPEHLVEVCAEGRAESRYRTGPPSRRVEFRFVAKGETFLPAALASMTAKYLRELAMKAFNHFWQQHVPGLKPTAGYPVDARRFLADIEAARGALQVPLERIWRKC
ncbi:MAG: hypothetical protein KJ000_29025 [Pirellulaceae bacterium]|nr:hypothetical protein [Pirellulaceae bacterium]